MSGFDFNHVALERELLAAVSVGVRHLDRIHSNWRDKIDLESLDLCKHEHCVLGQIYGNYDEGARMLALRTYEDAEERGFWLKLNTDFDQEPGEEWGEMRERQWALLTDIWKEAAETPKPQPPHWYDGNDY